MIAVDVALDRVRVGVARAALVRLGTFVLRAERVRHAMLSIALVTPRAIAKLNTEHLGHRGPTDVLTFALRPSPVTRHPSVVADVYICPAVARANASAAGVSPRDELQRLVVHGTLHAVGWDHPAGAGRERSPMWARQEQLLRAWRRRRA